MCAYGCGGEMWGECVGDSKRFFVTAVCLVFC